MPGVRNWICTMTAARSTRTKAVALWFATALLGMFLLYRADATKFLFRAWYKSPEASPPLLLPVFNSNLWWGGLLVMAALALFCTKRALTPIIFHISAALACLGLMGAIGLLYMFGPPYLELHEPRRVLWSEQVGCARIAFSNGTTRSPAHFEVLQVGRFKKTDQDCGPVPDFSRMGIRYSCDGPGRSHRQVLDSIVVQKTEIDVRTLLVLLGIHPILFAPYLVWRTSRRKALVGPLCGKCSYCLRGLSEPRCPECGTPFDAKSRAHADALQRPIQ